MGWTTKYIYIYMLVGSNQWISWSRPRWGLLTQNARRYHVVYIIYVCIIYIYIYVCVYSICMYVCIIYNVCIIYVCNVFLYENSWSDWYDWCSYILYGYMIDRLMYNDIYIYINMWDQLIIKRDFISEKRPLWYHSLRKGSETLYINCIYI